MSGYYGYSNGPTDIEELWTEIRKLRTQLRALEQAQQAFVERIEQLPSAKEM